MDMETLTQSAANAQSVQNSPASVIAIVTVGILAAIGVAAYIFFKRMPRKSFSSLQAKQRTLNTLDTSAILAWARTEKLEPDMERVVVMANRKWVTKLGYQFPQELSPENNVIAFVIDKASGDVSRECLFSFSEMSDKVRQLFGTEDCFFLRD